MAEDGTRQRRPEILVPPPEFTCPVAEDYAGPVYIWDLDKTYLQTHSDTLRELVRTALEKARDKLAYPGVATLMRALRRGADGQVHPTYFVSASPPQLRDVISEKLAMDGVDTDGIYFKDNLRNLRPGRTERLREQIGYKLLALLDLRQRLPAGGVETLFGDDAETDPRSYALFSDIIERRRAGRGLIAELTDRGVFRDEAVRIAWRARRVPARPGVDSVYIQVHRTVELESLVQIDPRIVPTRNYFQTALALYGRRQLGLETAAAIGDELRSEGVSLGDLDRSFADLVERRLLRGELAERARTRLVGYQILSPAQPT
jgi:hypothetical protein